MPRWRILLRGATMATVTLELFGELQNRLKRGQDRLVVEVDEGTTIGALVDRLDLRRDFYGASIGGRFVKEDYKIADGSTILLFSPMQGG